MKLEFDERRTLYRYVSPEGQVKECRLGGRLAWMLDRLAALGERGITSFEAPGARLSSYVRRLRLIGLDIATVMERNQGEFSGAHGRYVLTSKVQRIDTCEDVANSGGLHDGH